MELRQKIENYIRENWDRSATLVSIDRLGEGVHGTGYRITFSVYVVVS